MPPKTDKTQTDINIYNAHTRIGAVGKNAYNNCKSNADEIVGLKSSFDTYKTSTDASIRSINADMVSVKSDTVDTRGALNAKGNDIKNGLIGNLTQLFQSPLFSRGLFDQSKTYLTTSNVNLKRFGSDWVYFGPTEITTNNMTILTELSMASLSANLNNPNVEYYEVVDILDNLNYLTDNRMLCWNNILSDPKNNNLNINNVLPTTKYLLRSTVSADKYYTDGTKFYIPGPNIVPATLQFIEAKNGDYLIELLINTTNQYQIISNSSEFRIVKDSATNKTYIVANTDINVAKYPTKTLRLDIQISDSKYKYNRSYFLTVRDLNAVLIANGINNAASRAVIGAWYDALTVQNRKITFIPDFEPFSKETINDNCQMIRILTDIKELINSNALANPPANPTEDENLKAFASYLETTVSLIRSAITLDDYLRFVNSTRSVIDTANKLVPKYFTTQLMAEYEKYYQSMFATFNNMKSFLDNPYQKSVFDKFITDTVLASAQFRISTQLINGQLYQILYNMSKYQMGLQYFAYTGNSSDANGYYYLSETSNQVSKCVDWFKGRTAKKTGIAYYIDYYKSGFSQFRFYDDINPPIISDDTNPQNVALSMRGYFKADETGEWKILLGSPKIDNRNGNYSNDDVCALWLGPNALNPSFTNASKIVNSRTYGSDANPDLEAYTFRVRLEQGKHYPLLINWGQTIGGAVLCLFFARPSDPNNFNVAGGEQLFIEKSIASRYLPGGDLFKLN